MAPDTWPNLVTMFFRQADRCGERPLLWHKHDGRFVPLTWREVAVKICMFARGLRSLGIGKGDRVVLVAENRPAWFVADFAIMAIGGITVPAYTTNTEADHLHILQNSGAAAVIVSTGKLAKRLIPAARQCPDIRFMVTVDKFGLDRSLGFDVLTCVEVMARGEKDHTNVRAMAQTLQRTDTACIIYTSGTGGAPKGVMLHHGAILSNIEGAIEVLAEVDLGDEVFLSFLPLSHAYEHTVGQFLPIAIGAEIYYAEGADRVAANIREVRPTIFSAVPRFYEFLQQRILHGVRKQGGLRASGCSTWPRGLAAAATRIRAALGIGSRLVDLLLDRLVRKKVRERFGGRLKAMVSGGAAAQSRHRDLLPCHRPADLSGLWPDRDVAADQRRSSQAPEAAHRRSADQGSRSAHRRGRRDPGARGTGDAGLLAQREGNARSDARRLAAHRRRR